MWRTTTTYDFPDELLGLSMKRVEKILDLCVKERQDAALNVVVIGLKAMNHVHGYGLHTAAAADPRNRKNGASARSAGRKWRMGVFAREQ